MDTVKNDNVITLLKSATQHKLLQCASKTKMSPDTLLNLLIDDEFERLRLLECNKESAEGNTSAPTQKIAKLCKQYLTQVTHESESDEIRGAIEALYNELLRQNLLSVNAREGSIVESKRLKIPRTAYYWYGGSLATYSARWFGTIDVYLWHEILASESEVVFVGMAGNVEVSYQVCSHLCKLFKKIKTTYKKNMDGWGSKSEQEEDANHYISNFTRELEYTDAFIDNDDYGEVVFNYAAEKYAYAMRY